ncbi:MAG: hypothetical protein LBR37_01635 [Erysipelotrichaceae bacterium]|jgi:hypothetical protein|nr:hypothetical protein [Erysipelotrichaceae bacterium]
MVQKRTDRYKSNHETEVTAASSSPDEKEAYISKYQSTIVDEIASSDEEDELTTTFENIETKTTNRITITIIFLGVLLVLGIIALILVLNLW